MGRKGTAAVELALISPLLMVLFAGMIDFGRVYQQEIELSGAVASAAEYALVNVASVSSGNAATLAAAISGIVANSNGGAWADVTVTVNNGATSIVTGGVTTSSGTAANADLCWCPTGSPPNWIWGASVTCGVSCAGGNLAGKFITIAGSHAFTAIFASYGLIGNTALAQNMIVQAK